MSPNTSFAALAVIALSASTLANPVERRHKLSDDQESSLYCPAPVTLYVTVTPTMTVPANHPTSDAVSGGANTATTDTWYESGSWGHPGKPSHTGGSGPAGSSSWDLTSASGEPPLATGDFSNIPYTTVTWTPSDAQSTGVDSTIAESASTTESGEPSSETGSEAETSKGAHQPNPTFTITLSNYPVQTSSPNPGSEDTPSPDSSATGTILTVYPEPTSGAPSVTTETISESKIGSAAASSTTPCPEESGSDASASTTTPCPESSKDHHHTHTNPGETPCPESDSASASATNSAGATITTTAEGETTKTPCPESDSATTTTPCPESSTGHDHTHTHTNPTETPCPESESASQSNAPTSPPQPTNTHNTLPPYPTNTNAHSECPTPIVVYSTLTATTTIIATVTSFPGSWTTSLRR